MARSSVAWFIILAVVGAFLAAPGSAQELNGKGSIGGSGGLMLFTADDDLSKAARPRLLGHIDMKYVIHPRLAVHGTFGRGWNAYSGRSDTLSIIEPVTFGIEYRHAMEQWPRYLPHVGFGVGVYSLWVRERLKVTQDLETLEERHTVDWGMNLTAGLEYFMTRNVTINYDFVWHRIFSENQEDFPTGFGENDSYVQFVVGINYYFSMDVFGGGDE